MLPVPEVYGYEAAADNKVRAAFMLMNFIPGDTAMDASGGYDCHRGEIPPQNKPRFCDDVAKAQVGADGRSWRNAFLTRLYRRKCALFDFPRFEASCNSKMVLSILALSRA